MKTQNTQLKPAGPRIASRSAGLLIRLNTYRAAVLALFLAGATLLGTSATSAGTITVININDSGPGSLRQALVKANNGDTINFDSSLNGQRITLTSGQLNVDKDVTISGPGAKNMAVDGTTQSRVFYVNPGKTVTIDGLTVANGYTGFYGGGIYNDSATLTVTNCMLSGNSAYSGGGIRNESANGGATLTVTNSTISGNSAGYHGGGILNDAFNAGFAGVETGNTIFDAGSSGENIFNYAGTVTSLGYNVSSDDGGGFLPGPGDQINTNPLLGPLQDNGGSTYTHALLPTSPAINAGDPSFTPPPFYDQRGPGFYRVVNGRIDVGSFEVQGPRPTPTPRPSPTPRHRPTPVPRP